MIIYKLTNKINTKIYIGQTKKAVQQRFKEHMKPCYDTYISRAIKKHGKENFIVETIFESESLDEINKAEIEAIIKFNSLKPHGYNVHTGGNNHITLLETKLKIGAANKGRRPSITTEIKPGQHLSPKTEFKKGLIPKSRKQVIDVTSGFIYDSISEAADSIGIKMHTLAHRIKYSPKRFTYRFQLVESF